MNICANCKIMTCSWMRHGIPVEGWTATKGVSKRSDSSLKSYNVTTCPYFQKATRKDNMISSAIGAVELEEKIKERALEDYIKAKLELNKHPHNKEALKNKRDAEEYLSSKGIPLRRFDTILGGCTSMKELRAKMRGENE